MCEHGVVGWGAEAQIKTHGKGYSHDHHGCEDATPATHGRLHLVATSEQDTTHGARGLVGGRLAFGRRLPCRCVGLQGIESLQLGCQRWLRHRWGTVRCDFDRLAGQPPSEGPSPCSTGHSDRGLWSQGRVVVGVRLHLGRSPRALASANGGARVWSGHSLGDGPIGCAHILARERESRERR